MAIPDKISISVDKTLLDQAEHLAGRLNIPRDQLVALALEQFINNPQNQALLVDDQPTTEQVVINQGDIYWMKSDKSPDISHPHLVIQDDLLNHSRINTVIVCALTSNIKRVNIPGNVLLDAGEANLPRQSVVEVAKLSTIEKSQFGEYIGTLNEKRIHQILAGLKLVQQSFFAR